MIQLFWVFGQTDSTQLSRRRSCCLWAHYVCFNSALKFSQGVAFWPPEHFNFPFHMRQKVYVQSACFQYGLCSFLEAGQSSIPSLQREYNFSFSEVAAQPDQDKSTMLQNMAVTWEKKLSPLWKPAGHINEAKHCQEPTNIQLGFKKEEKSMSLQLLWTAQSSLQLLLSNLRLF